MTTTPYEVVCKARTASTHFAGWRLCVKPRGNEQKERIKRREHAHQKSDRHKKLQYKQQLFQYTLMNFKMKVHKTHTIFQYFACILPIFHVRKLTLLPLHRKIFLNEICNLQCIKIYSHFRSALLTRKIYH